MSELERLAAALLAGTAAALVVALLGRGPGVPSARAWLRRRSPLETDRPRLGPGLGRTRARLLESLGAALERAGWVASPQRVALAVVVLAAGLGTAGAATGLALGGGASAAGLAAVGTAAGPALVGQVLVGGIRRRRMRARAELAPVLELMTLELSSGAGVVAAMGSVATQTEGLLATEFRHLLIASQVAGSDRVEERLAQLGDRLQLAPLGGLAAIVGTSREHGAAALPGVRALAADLRRAQRRELIASGRRSLNRVVIPAAVGVLLPFIGVLLYPALAGLSTGLR